MAKWKLISFCFCFINNTTYISLNIYIKYKLSLFETEKKERERLPVTNLVVVVTYTRFCWPYNRSTINSTLRIIYVMREVKVMIWIISSSDLYSYIISNNVMIQL